MFNLKTFLFKKKTVCICGNCVTGVIPEFLNSYVTSILPGVEKALNFEITSDWDNRRWTLDLVKDTYSYYDRHPELVKSNMKFIEDMWVK